ncbi:MAG: class I SAM-dependent methyltransferase [Dehalococcoidia bacterium]
MTALGRRWFAWVYDVFGTMLTRATMPQRRALLEGLDGRVLEIGCGPGNNFPLYPPGLEVVATDISEPMLERARTAARGARASITVELADVEALPFADASFDATVGVWVLCSIDQPRALRELHRVLRPGGALRLWEHVRSEHAAVATLQRVATPAWGVVADGCHLDRDTVGAVRAAGFEVERADGDRPAHVLIVARRPV